MESLRWEARQKTNEEEILKHTHTHTSAERIGKDQDDDEAWVEEGGKGGGDKPQEDP